MDLPELDDVIHQPVRLRIMTALYRHRRLSYVTLRDAFQLTDGNLATHTARLQGAGLIRSGRILQGLSFVVVYEITPAGSEAFRSYLDKLAKYLGPGDDLLPAGTDG